jgi:hypothetical protein
MDTQTSAKLEKLLKEVDEEKIRIIKNFSEEFKKKYKLKTEYTVLAVYYYADSYPDYWEYTTLYYLDNNWETVAHRVIYNREYQTENIPEDHHDFAKEYIPPIVNYQHEHFDEYFLPDHIARKLS